MLPILIVVILVLCIPSIWVIVVYNRLVRSRVRAHNGFSQIDVQLKRRCDLIPNLVESVKGYMTHERTTLESVIAARNATVAGLQSLVATPHDGAVIRALAGSSAMIDNLLMRLRVSMEAYPDLKASANVLGLQEELVSTENRIAFARQAYNDAVMTFNTNIAVFPSSVIASLGRFSPLTLFEATGSDRILPEVRF